MKAKHSKSLLLVWRVAAVEAKNLKAASIDPMHLLLGLCKVVDLDLPRLVSENRPDREEWLEECRREVGRLRSVFHSAAFDPMKFRRLLRAASPAPRFALDNDQKLRRSPATKAVFSQAEKSAEIGSGSVYPVHLLHAMLLAGDTSCEETFTKAHADKKRLLAVAEREALIAQIGSDSQEARTRWN